jgi:hypothetical protein
MSRTGLGSIGTADDLVASFESLDGELRVLVEALTAAFRVDQHYTRHACGPTVPSHGRAYERWLGAHDVCEDCGWSPSLPLPSLHDTAARLCAVLEPDDVEAWWRLLGEHLGLA